VGFSSALKRGQSQLLAEPAGEGNAGCHPTAQGVIQPLLSVGENSGIQGRREHRKLPQAPEAIEA